MTQCTSSGSTYEVGRGVNNQDGNGRFTIGIYVQRSVGPLNLYGFITAGHPFYYDNGQFKTNNTSVYIGSGSSQCIGYVYPGDTSINGMDYSFVQLNSNYQPTTRMADGGTISSLYTDGVPSEGTTIYLLGVVGGLSRGTVDYTLITNPLASPYVSYGNGFTVNYYDGYGGVLHGDSGGAHYIIQYGVRKLVGFQSAGDNPTGQGGRYLEAFVQRADYVFNALGVSIYS